MKDDDKNKDSKISFEEFKKGFFSRKSPNRSYHLCSPDLDNSLLTEVIIYVLLISIIVS